MLTLFFSFTLTAFFTQSANSSETKKNRSNDFHLSLLKHEKTDEGTHF